MRQQQQQQHRRNKKPQASAAALRPVICQSKRSASGGGGGGECFEKGWPCCCVVGRYMCVCSFEQQKIKFLYATLRNALNQSIEGPNQNMCLIKI